jgi:hypothetical protein
VVVNGVERADCVSRTEPGNVPAMRTTDPAEAVWVAMDVLNAALLRALEADLDVRVVLIQLGPVKQVAACVSPMSDVVKETRVPQARREGKA